VPVTVYSFRNIGSVSLNLQYDPAVLTYQSSGSHSEFAGLTINGDTPGTITVVGSAPEVGAGITLDASAVLFTLTFNYLGGSSTLAWTDNGTLCKYKGPTTSSAVLTDSPRASYFINGSVDASPVPDPAGSIISPWGKIVDPGQEGVVYRVDPITNATGYAWTLPVGALITKGENTPSITVTYTNSAVNGDVTVAGFNSCYTGDVSAAFQVIVKGSSGIGSFGMNPDDKGYPSIVAYPNPFQTLTTLNYTLSEPGNVSVELLNLLGERMPLISNEFKTTGVYTIKLGSNHFNPGVYIVRITLKTSQTVRMNTIKIICN
jgi:hypothetical protein